MQTWNAEKWRSEFFGSGHVDFHALRKQVWENTLAIVQEGGYVLPDGREVKLTTEDDYDPWTGELCVTEEASFYSKPITASFKKLDAPAEITVVPDDCLDVAYRWRQEGLTVSVLNMASRQNPGGGVRNGAGAQEEYLFRCSNYYQSLYQFTSYAKQYGLQQNEHQYPLDKNFGGIFSPYITIFRSDERSGYSLLERPWTVNMIAVPGMNRPALERRNGEERIAVYLVEGVKNKLRTILRIAACHGQRNLVLGAIGCGAFRNPPKHIAELFREVLCEDEFLGAFQRVCFAVKSDHNSCGSTNYDAFREVLDGFVPPLRKENRRIKKVVAARYRFALLYEDGGVEVFSRNIDQRNPLGGFQNIKDITAGFYHFVGIRGDDTVIFSQDDDDDETKSVRHVIWQNAKGVYACEGHTAMLDQTGRLFCVDRKNDPHFDYSRMQQDPTPQYGSTVQNWRNVKQLALTFDYPFALTVNGAFLSTCTELNEYFNNGYKRIQQIAAYGSSTCIPTIAALYEDGTVRAVLDFDPDSQSDHRNIKQEINDGTIVKVGCGLSAVAVLRKDGRVLFSRPYRDNTGGKICFMDNIMDFSMLSEYFLALNNSGEIILLEQ